VRAATLSLVLLAWAPISLVGQKNGGVTIWLTNGDKSALFDPTLPPQPFERPRNQNPTIVVDDRQTFQTMDGFGFTLTGGSAQHLMRMSAAGRAALLQELFGVADKDAGVSYLRVSIGASDWSSRVFTYDDAPPGQTDAALRLFSLDEDRRDVIPALREILKVNPRIQILASPWTAPSWMKTNAAPKGGSLKPECYAAYAGYFVKYIQGMKAEGIPIAAVTVQNEPLNGKNTPSMIVQAPEEAAFVARYLGPAFRQAKIKTRIILYDHDCDQPQYPMSILADARAARFADGSAFHLYAGGVEAMTQVRNAYPSKNIYFTEQMVTGSVEGQAAIDVSAPVARLLIGATRNWSRTVLLWNLAADSRNEPHTGDSGCATCQGAITLDGDAVKRNVAYYAMAHASRFVRPGSVRIGSTSLAELPNVAFKAPGGKRVLLVANPAGAAQTFNIQYRDAAIVTTLKPKSVGTYVW